VGPNIDTSRTAGGAASHLLIGDEKLKGDGLSDGRGKCSTIVLVLRSNRLDGSQRHGTGGRPL